MCSSPRCEQLLTQATFFTASFSLVTRGIVHRHFATGTIHVLVEWTFKEAVKSNLNQRSLMYNGGCFFDDASICLITVYVPHRPIFYDFCNPR